MQQPVESDHPFQDVSDRISSKEFSNHQRDNVSLPNLTLIVAPTLLSVLSTENSLACRQAAFLSLLTTHIYIYVLNQSVLHMYTKPTKFKSICMPSVTVKAIFSEAPLPLKFKYETIVPDLNRFQIGNFERRG